MIIQFPGPINKQEAKNHVEEAGWENGVILTIGKDDTDIVTFGSPTSAELLWLAEQLRLKALFNTDDEDETDNAEI